jgi:hypothetical protein
MLHQIVKMNGNIYTATFSIRLYEGTEETTKPMNHAFLCTLFVVILSQFYSTTEHTSLYHSIKTFIAMNSINGIIIIIIIVTPIQ